jgi:tetratricopeptide (TPR) repeat protein
MLSHFTWLKGRPEEAARRLEEALATLERLPAGPDLVTTYGRLAGRHMMAGESRDCIAAADKAITLGNELGVPEKALFARQARGVALCELGDRAGIDSLRDALHSALEYDSATAAGVGYNNLGHWLWLMESPRSGLETKLEGIAYGTRRGVGGGARWTRMETIWILFDLGEWDDVLTVGDELLEFAETVEETQVPAFVRPFRALVLALRGRAAEVASSPAEFVPHARQIGDPQVLVPALGAAAVVAHAAGDPRSAIAAIEELEDVTRSRPDWTRLLQAVPALRICTDAGELALGERLLDRPDAVGARAENAFVAGRAVAAEARGDVTEAAKLYAEAARRWREYEFPYEEAHALFGHARCTGDDESRRHADAIFRRLGAVAPEAPARAARESTG